MVVPFGDVGVVSSGVVVAPEVLDGSSSGLRHLFYTQNIVGSNPTPSTGSACAS
jgi:hypothetical protein